MTYTIQSAQWGDEARDSAVIMTAEVAAVAISARDTPEEWAAFQEWQTSNTVAELSPRPPPLTKDQKFDQFFTGLGMTPAEFQAKIALGLPP